MVRVTPGVKTGVGTEVETEVELVLAKMDGPASINFLIGNKMECNSASSVMEVPPDAK